LVLEPVRVRYEKRRVASLVVHAIDPLSAWAKTEREVGSYVSESRRKRKLSESTAGMSVERQRGRGSLLTDSNKGNDAKGTSQE
jgi:hypothetical protein